MNDTCIHLACATDDTFARHCAASLFSVLESNPDAAFIIYILHSSLSTGNQEKIRQSLTRSSLLSLEFIEGDLSSFKDCDGDRFSKAAFLRVLLPKYINKTIRKILYIDVDTICLLPIAELWGTDLHDSFCAAVENPIHRNVKHKELLGLSDPSSYFNSGVMLINLEKWREEDIPGKFITLHTTYSDKHSFWDQDIFNILFENKWTRLHPRWNTIYTHFILAHLFKKLTPATTGYVFTDKGEDIIEASESPGIIHYTGAPKPWSSRSIHPRTHAYWHFLKQTKWAPYQCPDRTLKTMTIRRLKLCLIWMLKNVPSGSRRFLLSLLYIKR